VLVEKMPFVAVPAEMLKPPVTVNTISPGCSCKRSSQILRREERRLEAMHGVRLNATRNEFTVFDDRIIVSPNVNDCARLFVPDRWSPARCSDPWRRPPLMEEGRHVAAEHLMIGASAGNRHVPTHCPSLLSSFVP
jgi:hypothetical protein